MFASGTAHATAMLPVMLAVGSTIPALPMRPYALLLCLTLGIMGVISPYGTRQIWSTAAADICRRAISGDWERFLV